MTESAKKKRDELVKEHTAGLEIMEGVIGEKVPGIIAYHKFIAGWNAGYAERDRDIAKDAIALIETKEEREQKLAALVLNLATDKHDTVSPGTKEVALKLLRELGIEVK